MEKELSTVEYLRPLILAANRPRVVLLGEMRQWQSHKGFQE